MTGLEAMLEERRCQRLKYGFTAKHSANHPQWYADGQLLLVAKYLMIEKLDVNLIPKFPKNWDVKWFKKLCNKPYQERLGIAGSFIAAEYDRIEELKKQNHEQ